jgi:PAS domain S-box-containing protein
VGIPTKQPDAEEDLRRRAERLAERVNVQPQADEAGTPNGYSLLVHELLVHKLELEMQNEELRRAQTELEIQKARYFDLYDLAPVGYFSVGVLGPILEANLTAITLLGLPRSAVVGQPFTRFILKGDQDAYYLFRKGLLESGETQVCELRMVKKDGTAFWGGLSAAVVLEAGVQVCRLTVSDVSSRRRAEEDLRRSLEEKEALLRELHRRG